MDSLTVVIPTFNREPVLKKALEGYLAQTAIQSIRELIVVDDGSTDNTETIVREIAGRSPFEIRYLRQENKGPAAARNLGIRQATSELILFTDDDIIPEPTLVAEHLAWHTRFPELPNAVLGYVTWAPEVKPTPFMTWYGSDGPLFAYDHFKDHSELNYSFFYACNLSIKTEFLRKNGTFDEDFKVAACEDIELGYRLSKRGMRLHYNPKALGYHQQYVSFDDACRRAKKSALAREVFIKKEAGRAYLNPPRLKQRIGRHFVKWAGPILSPLKGFMDGRIPFPWTVYRIMYRVFCN